MDVEDNEEGVDELSSILSKQSLKEVVASDNTNKELVSGNWARTNNEQVYDKKEVSKLTVNNTETQVLLIKEKVNNIIESWKGLLEDPLSSDIETIEKCLRISIESENVNKIIKALLSTFDNVRDILNLEVTRVDQKSQHQENNTGRDCIELVSSPVASPSRNNDKSGINDAQLLANDGVEEVNAALADGNKINAAIVESVRVTCAAAEDPVASADQTESEEVDNENISNVGDVDGDSEESSEECSGTQSEEDPSWTLSDSDNASERKIPKKRKQLPKVNFNTTKPAALGVWLSDTGPVHLNRMCHCKGSCLRNCSCKAAGIGCSIRCGCKPEKCQRWRKVRDVLEETDSSDSDTDEEYKVEKLRVKNIATTGNDTLEPSTRKLRSNPINSTK